MGLRAGKGAASAYRRGADVWKDRRAALVARPDALSVRAPEESSNLDAMVAIDVKVGGLGRGWDVSVVARGDGRTDERAV